MMRTLDELIDLDDPGWPIVEEWITNAKNPVEVLPTDRAAAEKALLEVQVTTRSPMGALIYESGGLLVEHGWLRVLGSGCDRLPRSIPSWNEEARSATEGLPSGLLLIADDVLGGLFALNGGAFDTAPGGVLYFAPDSLSWDDLEVGYSDFLVWALSGDLGSFWQGLRWSGWEEDVRSLVGDQAFSIWPPLCADPDLDIDQRSREAVPLTDVIGINFELGDQLD